MSDYEVGYRKPPKQHQFKRGEPSANPVGRPKGRKPKGVLDKLGQKVVVDSKNGRRVKKTLREVLDHNLVKDAVAGDKHARTLLYRVLEAAEKDEAAQKREAAKHPYGASVPIDPDEARRRLAEWFRTNLANVAPHVDEAIRLGIFEMPDGKPKLAAWARKAAEDRHIATAAPTPSHHAE
jgi:hypothetical protein